MPLRWLSPLALVVLIASACGGAVDKDASSSSSGGSTTTPPSGSSTSSTGGVTTPTPAAGACAASLPTPVIEDFDQSLNPTWGSTNVTAFAIDQKRPITGTGSLRGTFKGANNANSFLTVRLPAVCAIKLSFNVRFDAEFAKSSATFLRVTTEKTFFHFRVDNGAIMFAHTMGSVNLNGFALKPAIPEAETNIAFSLDVTKRQYELVTEGDPSSSTRTGQTSPDGSTAGAITSIEIGTAPDIASAAMGSFWLDDFIVQ